MHMPAQTTSPPPPQGSFGEGDLVPLPDSPLPTVEPVTSFGKLVSKLDAGEIYANVHSVSQLGGGTRGCLGARGGFDTPARMR